jgi:uncharacterized protein
MISVADLLTPKVAAGNYFATQTYVRSDVELGLLESRSGSRLIAIPDTLIKALYAGLEQETGLAARLVLVNCGRWWGKNFYQRFSEELAAHYGLPLSALSMVDFLQSLQQCWISHGWGKLDFDPSYAEQGLFLVKTWNSPFAAQAPQMDRPVCFMDAGILSAFFSALTGKPLDCLQLSCESLGADCNRFVLGLGERLEPVEALVEAQVDWETILQGLAVA